MIWFDFSLCCSFPRDRLDKIKLISIQFPKILEHILRKNISFSLLYPQFLTAHSFTSKKWQIKKRKVVPVLHQPPCQKNVWRSGGKSLSIPNICITRHTCGERSLECRQCDHGRRCVGDGKKRPNHYSTGDRTQII